MLHGSQMETSGSQNLPQEMSGWDRKWESYASKREILVRKWERMVGTGLEKTVSKMKRYSNGESLNYIGENLDSNGVSLDSNGERKGSS